MFSRDILYHTEKQIMKEFSVSDCAVSSDVESDVKDMIRILKDSGDFQGPYTLTCPIYYIIEDEILMQLVIEGITLVAYTVTLNYPEAGKIFFRKIFGK